MIKFRAEGKSSNGGIEGILNRLKDPTPALNDIAQMLKKSTEERISTTKKSPDGVSWANWAAGTARARQKKGNAAQGLLFDNGNLLRSITAEVIGGQAIVSTAVPYATYLQEGTDNMPARPFIGVSSDDLERIRTILKRYAAAQSFGTR